jgi:hypothetical protein
MWRDFVFAYRILKRSPIATAVTILALALGIGANTASFIAVNAIPLHAFPYPNLDRIVTMWGALPKTGLDRGGVTPADFEDWKQRNRSVALLSAYQGWTDGDRREPVQGARVGTGFFRIFGMKPIIGRTFTESAGESGNTRVAVLSNGLWRTVLPRRPMLPARRFRSAVRTIRLWRNAGRFGLPLATEVLSRM